MEIRCDKDHPLTIVSLAGRLDNVTATPALTELCSHIEEKQPQLMLNADLLDYISSAGLRTLLGVAKKVRAAGGKIVIFGMKDHVREILEISGFQSVIPSYPDAAAARAALGH